MSPRLCVSAGDSPPNQRRAAGRRRRRRGMHRKSPFRNSLRMAGQRGAFGRLSEAFSNAHGYLFARHPCPQPSFKTIRRFHPGSVHFKSADSIEYQNGAEPHPPAGAHEARTGHSKTAYEGIRGKPKALTAQVNQQTLRKGKRRRYRGRSHEWQPVMGGILGFWDPSLSQAFEVHCLGGFCFDGGKVFRPQLQPVAQGNRLVAIDRLLQVRQVTGLGFAIAVHLEGKMKPGCHGVCRLQSGHCGCIWRAHGGAR